MNTKISRPLLFLLLLTSTLLMQACATPDSDSSLQDHEKRFRQKVAYTTHMVEREGYRIHAREYGADNPGPVFIMMHGFPDNMHLYDWLIPELAAKRHIITFDFLGWGESDKPRDHLYDVSSLRQDLQAVIAYFGLEQVVPVVHDASGQPGIDWALENPGKTAGLVLLNTYYGPMPTLKAPEEIAVFSTPGLQRELAIQATRFSPTLWLRRYKAQIGKFISTEALRQPVQELFAQQSLAIRPAFYGLNGVLRQEVEKRAAKTTQLQAFQPPVRIIFGQDDPYLNAGVAKEFHKLFPHSELYLVEDAGHFVQIDKPVQVARLMADFPASRTSTTLSTTRSTK